MILPRCAAVLLASILAALPAAAQAPPNGPAPQNLAAAAPQATPVDERTVRLIERYKAMLASNPVEGLALDRLWKAAQDQGSTAALLDEYRQAAGAQPANVAAILVYGHLLQKAGRLDDARATFEHAASVDPDTVLAPLALGDLAIASGQPKEAAGSYEKAAGKLAADDRRRPDILLKLGNAWMAADEPLKAADAWEKIVAANPSDIALHQRLAENYEKNRLPERAIAHYEYIEQHAQPEQRAGALRELARLHESRGEFDAASAALDRGLTLTARDNWMHRELEESLIRLYQRAGRVPELAARWRADIAKAPRDLDGYLRLERLAATQGDAEAQRTWLEQIVALAPKDREDSLKLARLLSDSGERERAAALYDTLLKEQPGDLDLVLARAELDLQLGRPQAAVDRIEACIARTPTDESVTTPALQFFLSHHLDQAAEHRLQADAARQPAADEPVLALAKFYFSQRRDAEARATLEGLARRPGDPAATTARLLRIADCYKDEHLADDALRCWRLAADLDPHATAPWLAAADALASQAKIEEAQEAFEHALKNTPAGQGRVDIEHKIYELLRNADANPAAATIPSSKSAAPPLAGMPALPGRRVEHYIAHLEGATRAAPSADAYLRLARWDSWNHDAGDAEAAAEKVIALDPNNIPARELLISVAGETHQREIAEQRLREIMMLDPSRSAACRREIAELKMEDGSLDEAIALFSSLQEEAPGSVAALTDLALAQQRADRWYDALANWERAYSLPGATPAERNDVRRPLLLVLERLGQFARGAEILQTAIDEQADLGARQDLFAELAAYCQRHDLSGWLQKQYEARLAAQPTDYFSLFAAATLQKAAGHQREAYRLLQQADFSSPDPARSLQTLVTAAEALGETADAVSWQRRLLALPGQDTADNLERLANLQDGGFAIDDAAHTWDQAVARFPRQSDVLEKAVEFFQRSGRLGRARELLGQLAALDPADLKRAFQLGQLDLATGDRGGALVCFGQVLERSEPEKPGVALVPPADLKSNPERPDTGFAAAVARFRTRFTVVTPEVESAPAPPDDEKQLRLAAIRQISELLFPKANGDGAGSPAAGTERDRQQWIERWKTAAANGARSEPLWAFYFSRDRDLTMDTLAGWMKAAPADEPLRAAFTAAGMRLGAYHALAHWAWDEAGPRQSDNQQLLVNSLIDFLTGGGTPGPGMVAALFPPEATVRDLLWKAAEEGFAAQDRYAEAAELGERVASLSSSARANYAFPVAQWDLYLGRVDNARAVLRGALATTGGDTFDPSRSPIYLVLREYFLLLPESERAGFADEYLRKAITSAGPAHAALSAVLLHGLLGDWQTADADIDRLLSLRMLANDTGAGSADSRRWDYLQNNGLQLQEWGLEPLAVRLWQRALREASAFEQQDNETLTVRSGIRTRLLGLEVALASNPARARQQIENYLREDPQPGNVALLATQFRESLQWPAAVLLSEYLCRVEPADPEYWRNLFAAYQSAGDIPAYDQALTTLLDGGQPLPNSLSRVDLICREAGVREAEGDNEGARRLLERARQKSPRSVPLLEQLANVYLLTGQQEKAVDLWQQALPFDADGQAALALATLDEGRNRRQDAIDVLRQERAHQPGNFEATVQLARLYAAAGQIDDLRGIATERMQAGDLNALIGMAAGIEDKAACAALRSILADAARRAHDPQERFRAQIGVVDLYRTHADASGDDTAFDIEIRRLERFAAGSPALRKQFMQERFDVARKRGADVWLEAELGREWHDGTGDIEAGAMLVRLYLQTDHMEGLRKTAGEIDRRPDLPELTLYTIEQELGSSKYAALALPIAQRLTRRFPQKEAYVLARARTCWMAGQPEQARSLLEALDVTSAFVENVADRIGDLYAALGDRAGAREFYGRAVARDPWALHSSPAYLRLAQEDIEDKRFDAARQLLVAAYRNPACTDLSTLLAYLTATGRAVPDAANRLPGAEFPLSFNERARLFAALCESLEKSRPADAHRLAMAHPELWNEAPAVVDYLCADSAAGDWPALTAALEDALSQASPPSRQLSRALGLLYARWAEADSKESSRAADTMAHLTRAHDLLPDDFSIACRLAELYVDKKQPARAADVLRDFLTADAFPAERQQAEQILSRK
jgi:predicted Zn-dependent protease